MTTSAVTKRGLARKYWPVLAIVVAFAAAAVLLRWEGRLWICACSKFMIWSGNTCSSDNSQHFLDPYSFTHILHGFLFFWLIAWVGRRLTANWQLALAVVIEVFWEVFENTNFIIDRYRSQTAALGYTGDTVVNSYGDIFCCLVGFMITRRLGLVRSLLSFAVLEVVLIFWIRDSLLLEILMLVFPIDAIKAMQMCA